MKYVSISRAIFPTQLSALATERMRKKLCIDAGIDPRSGRVSFPWSLSSEVIIYSRGQRR